MLDGMNAYGAVTDGRRAFDRLQVLNRGVNCRFFREIPALEFNSRIDCRRLEPERHFRARVERGPAEAGGLRHGLLHLARGRHRRVSNKDSGE